MSASDVGCGTVMRSDSRTRAATCGCKTTCPASRRTSSRRCGLRRPTLITLSPAGAGSRVSIRGYGRQAREVRCRGALGCSSSFRSRWGSTGPQLGDHLVRQRLGPDLVGIGGIAADPHPGLEAFDRKRAVLDEAVADLEARALDLGDLGLDHDVVAVAGRQQEAGAGVDHGIADAVVCLDELELGHAAGT